MIGVWVVFTMMLFVLEPLILHKLFHAQAKKNPKKTFRIIQTMHWLLLSISIITVLGAVMGAHGMLLFE